MGHGRRRGRSWPPLPMWAGSSRLRRQPREDRWLQATFPSNCVPSLAPPPKCVFLRRIVREFPTGELHIVLDNSSTHGTPEVKPGLARHQRVTFRFTPTSAS